MKKKIASSLAILFASLMALPTGALAADKSMPPPDDSKTASENSLRQNLIGPIQETPRNYMTLSVTSYHSRNRKNGDAYNDINPGLGFEHVNPFFKELGDGGLRTLYVGGFYLNSFERLTFYVGAGIEACSSLKASFSVCAGVVAGGATGYPKHTVAPMIAPYLKTEHNETGIFTKIGLIPPHNDRSPTVLTLQFGKSF